MKGLFLSLLLTILTFASGFVNRDCQLIELSTSYGQPVFFELSNSIEGRFFVPFSVEIAKVCMQKRLKIPSYYIREFYI